MFSVNTKRDTKKYLDNYVITYTRYINYSNKKKLIISKKLIIYPSKQSTIQQIWALGWWSVIVVVLISAWHVGQAIFTGFGARAYIKWWRTTRSSGRGTEDVEFDSALKCGWDVDWLDTDGVGIVIWFGGWLSKIILHI